MVSARIVEYHPERVLPLAEVRDRVLAQVRTQQAAAAARKDGEARLAALKQNPAETLPQDLVVSRTQTKDQPHQVIDAALRADIGKGPAVLGVDLGDEGYVAVKVVKRVEREANDPDNERIRPMVAQALSAAESMAYYEALKRRYKVEVKLKPATSEEAASAASK
jgi:peptidyl-prolyl cis-trans isomerase D